MAKRAEARRPREKVGARNNAMADCIYLDGTLRRVKMDAPVVDDACASAAGSAGRRLGGGGDAKKMKAPSRRLRAGKQERQFTRRASAKRVPAGSTIMFQMHYSAFRGALKSRERPRPDWPDLRQRAAR